MEENKPLMAVKRKLSGYEKVRNHILIQIQKKRYIIGTQLHYQDVKEKAESKIHYQRALYFLEGAGIVVNEVVITDKVPKELLQRVGIVDE
ncbi:hypothetical protein [Listeria grayi]|uniref:hypothetical protein n=1 Tax=Listeria grayi TaxID=1641 RepID=UPI00162990E5|nr:hypothetical protein [Listeria grayi]MBC1922989.1 hypothetical protein [Listeria grayi]